MPEPREPQFVDLVWLLNMTHEEYLDRFRGTAIRRAKHWMLQRNAAVALGNTGGPEALPALESALRTNPNPIVRAHAAWAIGQVALRAGLIQAGRRILSAGLQDEADEGVREEIELALADIDGHAE